MKNRLIIIFTIISFSTHLYGSEALNIKSDKFSLKAKEIPAKWRYKKNILGFDHLLVIHTSDRKHTSSLSISPTYSKLKLISDKLEKNIKDYQNGKLKWFKKHNIDHESFIKYKKIQGPSVNAYKVGVNYATKILGKIKERTYLVNCKDDSLIYLKALLLKEHFKYEEKLDEFVKHISFCTNKTL